MLLLRTQNFVKNHVEIAAWIAWIVAEIEPYSIEPMRDSSESEEDDVHESQDERRKGNTSWCLVLFKLGRAARERMFVLRGDRGSRKKKFQVNNTFVFSSY